MFKRTSQISSTLLSERQHPILKDEHSIKVQPFLEQRLQKLAGAQKPVLHHRSSMSEPKWQSKPFFLHQNLKIFNISSESESTGATLRYTVTCIKFSTRVWISACLSRERDFKYKSTYAQCK